MGKKLLQDNFREAKDKRLRRFIEGCKNGGSSSEKTIYELIKELQSDYRDDIQNAAHALEILDTLKLYIRTEKRLIHGERRRRLKKGIDHLRAKIKSGDPERSFETLNSPHRTRSFSPSRNMIFGAFLGLTLLTALALTLVLSLLIQPEPGSGFLTTLHQRFSEEPAEAFEIFFATWLLLGSIFSCALLSPPIRRRVFEWGMRSNKQESRCKDSSDDSISTSDEVAPEE